MLLSKAAEPGAASHGLGSCSFDMVILGNDVNQVCASYLKTPGDLPLDHGRSGHATLGNNAGVLGVAR